MISVDWKCHQWFRKLIVSYLNQYQTSSVETAGLEYTKHLSDFRYCTIVWHFCSGQSVYQREWNPKHGITSSFILLSEVISKLTECGLSPNSLYASRVKAITTEMFKCLNNINPTSYKSRNSVKCCLLIALSSEKGHFEGRGNFETVMLLWLL